MLKLLLVLPLVFVTACDGPTAPPDPAVPPPSFATVCEIPHHMSGDCLAKLAVASGGFVGMVLVCSHGPSGPCVISATANAAAWIEWQNTLDANGIPYDAWPVDNHTEDRWFANVNR